MAADSKVDVVDDKKLKKEKKNKDKSEKKEKKEKKRSESEGVHKEKKDKKKEKAKQDKLARALDAHLQADAAASAAAEGEIVEVDPEDIIKPAEDLVPFALPLADDKTHKKIYKLIKKGAKLKSIHRGVKECEKAIKKCPIKTAASGEIPAPALVIIAGDISPMDVIMHFPILCEEHGVPYLYVRSRADLGVAACTKRATSVVMLKPEGKKGGDNNNNNHNSSNANDKGKKKDDYAEMEDGEDKKVSAEEYLKSWKELVKTAEKEWQAQVQPWVKGVHPLQIAAREKSRLLEASS